MGITKEGESSGGTCGEISELESEVSGGGTDDESVTWVF